MTITENETHVKHATHGTFLPVAWRLADLPQGNGRPCVTARLVLADGSERKTMLANRTVRGLRQQVRTHPVLAGLPERVEPEGGRA
jgi:hypothetical protein